MFQSQNNVLAVRFTCANTIAQGNVVEITTDNTVAVPSAAGSLKIVGSVDSYAYGATECVVATKFRQRRDDRIAGENFDACGPFVWGNDKKVYVYDDQTHSPAAIAGLVIKIGDATEAVETLEY